MLSGFEHHLHRSGHPLRKTVVRTPGPSLAQKCWTWRTVPVVVARAISRSFAACSVSERDPDRARRLDEHAAPGYRPHPADGNRQRHELEIGRTERDHHAVLLARDRAHRARSV